MATQNSTSGVTNDWPGLNMSMQRHFQLLLIHEYAIRSAVETCSKKNQNIDFCAKIYLACVSFHSKAQVLN